jgi:hypothetical protein
MVTWTDVDSLASRLPRAVLGQGLEGSPAGSDRPTTFRQREVVITSASAKGTAVPERLDFDAFVAARWTRPERSASTATSARPATTAVDGVGFSEHLAFRVGRR